MQKKIISLTLFIFSTLILTACNLPSNTEEGISMEEQAATLAAQTLTAAAEQVPTETKVPLSTPTQAPPTQTPQPEASPTATQNLAAPEAPSLKNYNFTCAWNGTNLDLSITIEWNDKASNENGYYIYRNRQQIADLGPNSAVYVDLYAVDSGTPVNYAIEAYNNLGRSEQIGVTATCQ